MADARASVGWGFAAGGVALGLLLFFAYTWVDSLGLFGRASFTFGSPQVWVEVDASACERLRQIPTDPRQVPLRLKPTERGCLVSMPGTCPGRAVPAALFEQMQVPTSERADLQAALAETCHTQRFEDIELRPSDDAAFAALQARAHADSEAGVAVCRCDQAEPWRHGAWMGLTYTRTPWCASNGPFTRAPSYCHQSGLLGLLGLGVLGGLLGLVLGRRRA